MTNTSEYNRNYYAQHSSRIAAQRELRKRQRQNAQPSIDLRAVREAAGLGRTELAERLGLSPRTGRITLAQMEDRDDWFTTSLAAYFKACGATARIVTANGTTISRLDEVDNCLISRVAERLDASGEIRLVVTFAGKKFQFDIASN